MNSLLARLVAWLRGDGPPRERVDAPAATKATERKARAGYFVQVGLDLGTAYLKCVCRDVNTDTAWVHRFPASERDPGFVSSATLWMKDGRIARTWSEGATGLPSLKVCLRHAAMGRWCEEDLNALAQAAGEPGRDRMEGLVLALTGFLVADAMASVRTSVRGRLRGFGRHQDDYLAVNMAIPVADAQNAAVNAAFGRILAGAFRLSERLQPGARLSLDEIQHLWVEVDTGEGANATGACYVYPEVSANVQGFVRSRVSREGVYLFSDTGASTVDESVFIFYRNDGREALTYLHASVLPLGSGLIERRAAAASGVAGSEELERLRQIKEGGLRDRSVDAARNEIANDLLRETKRTLLAAKMKLNWRQQLDTSRVIFGGGGHTAHPYETGVLKAFKSEIFSRNLSPDAIGMPVPADLELAPNDHKWMKRLSVAYGLSFERHQLTPFIYPRDVEPPTPDQLWRPMRRVVHAPSKEEV